jgi:hypothetical protein
MIDTLKPPHCAWQGTFWPSWLTCRCVVVHKKPVVLCAFSQHFLLIASLKQWKILEYVSFFTVCPSWKNLQWMWHWVSIVCSVDCHPHSQGYTDATHKPLFLALPPYYLHSLSNRNVSERGFCSKAQNVTFANCSVANIYECDKPTIHRNKQLTLKYNSISDDRTLKWHNECYQLLPHFIYFKKLRDSRNFWGYYILVFTTA